MPKQSPLRLIKRCLLNEQRDNWDYDVPATRGFYVLYQKKKDKFNVKYIGVGGIGKEQKTGIYGRLKKHAKTKKDWDYYSIFEVHDNITSAEIRELEILFLTIFSQDQNVQLLNKQKKSNDIKKLSNIKLWSDAPKNKIKKVLNAKRRNIKD